MKGFVPRGFLLTALLGVGVVKLVQYYRKTKDWKKKFHKLIPEVQVSDGHVTYIERFGNYVVRQIGLPTDTPAAKTMEKLAEDYIRGDKTRSDDSLDNLFHFLSGICPSIDEREIERLNRDCIAELDVCMVTYFSFHWNIGDKIIDQVIKGGLQEKRSFKAAVHSATRKLRIERVVNELKTKRWFSNMVEMMRAMGQHTPKADEANVVEPVPAALRTPVLLLIGGGMGAGKSTVVKTIMKGPFWKSVSTEAVVVEADAFKEQDVIYRALNSFGDGRNVPEAAEVVHESSTNAASSLLVTALNAGRDVILDGTMSWEPFVLQTVDMARDVHNRHYRMGRGYGKNSDGSVFEEYWEPDEDWNEAADPNETSDPGQVAENGLSHDVHDSKSKRPLPVTERKPYRIEFVGVVCDAHLAVVRGMRRAILTKRTVPVRGQLRSHKLFAASLERYSNLMDLTKIYSTSTMGGPEKMIGFKDGHHNLLKDCDAFSLVDDLKTLEIGAHSVLELYGECKKKWYDFAMAEARIDRQRLLVGTLSNPHLQRKLSEIDWALVNSPQSSTPSTPVEKAQSPSATPIPEQEGDPTSK